MTHQDGSDDRKNLLFLKQIFEEFIPAESENISRHGNSTLRPGWLAAVALVCWGWTRAEHTLSQRFEMACSTVNHVLGGETTATRQGIMNALGSLGNELVEVLLASFTEKLKRFKGYWSRGGMVDLAVDGTKFLAPRTEKNQAEFCVSASSASNDCKAASVQMLSTVFWHINSGLPFAWKIAGSSGSERVDAASLVDRLPPNARLIGDAEYVGYPLWSTIIQSGRSFLFRVGSNIRLLKNLGPMKYQDGYVYMWSDKATKKKQRPLVLKLFRIHNGRKTIYLVTNELDMPQQQAAELYRQRWGIEVFFRVVKQTCQKRKLICGSPRNVLTELNWMLLGIWLAHYVGKQTLREAKTNIQRLSPVKVLRSFYRVVDRIAMLGRSRLTLTEQLKRAVITNEDGRKSSKRNRKYPKKKKHKPTCGPPQIKAATSTQRKAAEKLLN